MKTLDEEDKVQNSVEITCATCKKKFKTKASHKERRKYCSMECRKLSPSIRKAEEMTSLVQKEKLTPAESAKIRGQIATYVTDQIKDAHSVVMGAIDWNPTQARVFGILLNKVIPDLNASFVQHEHTTKQITELSREDLEAIASGISSIEVEALEVKNEDKESGS